MTSSVRGARDPQSAALRAGARQSERFGVWLDLHSLAMLVGTAVSVASGASLPIAAAGALSFGWLAVAVGNERRRLPRGAAWALAITVTRLVLVLAAAALMGALGALAIFTVFTVNVALDVADGAAARRHGGSTELGAVLDREADGVFVLVACAWFVLAEGFGAWVLVPGILPYVYRPAMRVLCARCIPERREPLAAHLAGLNFVVLLGAVLVPNPIRAWLLVASVGVVVFSFTVSFCRSIGRDAGPLS